MDSLGDVEVASKEEDLGQLPEQELQAQRSCCAPKKGLRSVWNIFVPRNSFLISKTFLLQSLVFFFPLLLSSNLLAT